MQVRAPLPIFFTSLRNRLASAIRKPCSATLDLIGPSPCSKVNHQGPARPTQTSLALQSARYIHIDQASCLSACGKHSAGNQPICRAKISSSAFLWGNIPLHKPLPFPCLSSLKSFLLMAPARKPSSQVSVTPRRNEARSTMDGGQLRKVQLVQSLLEQAPPGELEYIIQGAVLPNMR